MSGDNLFDVVGTNFEYLSPCFIVKMVSVEQCSIQINEKNHLS
jgi:hypothetical protein